MARLCFCCIYHIMVNTLSFYWYYWAAQLMSVMLYFVVLTNEPQHWSEMESHGLTFLLPSYIYSDTVKRLRKQTKDPIVKHMLTLCYDVQKQLKEARTHTLSQ